MQSSSVVPEVLGDVHTQLGESPWWDGARLSWIDILGKTLHTMELATGHSVTYETPGIPGFAIPTESGDYAVGLGDGLYTFTPDGQRWRQT